MYPNLALSKQYGIIAEAPSIVEILTKIFVGVIKNRYHAKYLNCMDLQSIDRFSSSFIFAQIFLNTGIPVTDMNWVKGLLKRAKNAQARDRTWIPCREMLYLLSYSDDKCQTHIAFILLGNSLARQAKVSRFGSWYMHFLLFWNRPQLSTPDIICIIQLKKILFVHHRPIFP